MPLVFITPYKKTYSSEFCSLSTLIGFIFLILAIFIPLFAAFSSEDFWLRLKEYIDNIQMDIRKREIFEHEFKNPETGEVTKVKEVRTTYRKIYS